MTYQVKNRFQNVPFKRNLQRYTVVVNSGLRYTETLIQIELRSALTRHAHHLELRTRQ